MADVNHWHGELDKLGLTFAGLQREKSSAHLHIFAGSHNCKNSFPPENLQGVALQNSIYSVRVLGEAQP